MECIEPAPFRSKDSIVNRLAMMTCSLLCAVGCAPTDETKVSAQGAAAADADDAVVSIDERLSLGRDTYMAACAACHDEATGGVPALGDAEAWSARSPLWESVLKKHVKDGYLQMPAKGGHTALSDEAVAAAVEYLVTRSQPDRLPSD